MIIACLGDSLTEGDYGIPGRSGIGNVKKESYPYYLQKLLGGEVRNYGKCGYRSSALLEYYDDGNIDVKGADAVLILLGSNGGQSSTEDTEENRCYLKLIDRVRRDAPDAKIYLMTPPNATVNPDYSNCGYMPQVREAQIFTERTAEKLGLPLIDLARCSYLKPELEYIMQPNDGLHFGRIGYAKIADVVASVLSRYREPPFDTVGFDAGNVKTVAHRGLSGIECQNTAASFIAAGNRSYWGIETDIRRTRDGRLVCIHDDNTSAVCGESLTVERTDFAALRALEFNCVDRKTPEAELRIPTLEEYIRVCKRYGKHCVAELKCGFDRAQAEELISLFEEQDYLGHTTFIAFDIDNLRQVRRLRPDQDCQYLTGVWGMTKDRFGDMLKLLYDEHMDLDTDYCVLTKDSVDALHNHGIKVNAWTVDNPDMAEYLVGCGVDMITTNILEAGAAKR